ncbi:MAG TPA: cyclase family protein [Usitatibacter sp.]|nr:cyclase family protein [Usitatibacter sp.]
MPASTPRTRRWSNRPEGSNWGDFGDDDQLGSVNYITPEAIRRLASEIIEGLAFCLSLPLDYPGGSVLAPHRFPPTLRPTQRHGHPFFNYRFGLHEGPGFHDVGCDDVVTLCTQYSTQWDSLAHIGHEFDADGDGVPELCYYNGFVAGRDIRAPEERSGSTAMPLAIDAFAARPIQGRGVMIDLAHHFGRESRNVGYADLRQVLSRDRIEVRPGDILCIHTGFAAEILAMNRQVDRERAKRMCAALDGTDARLLEWITESRISAIAADNYAVERIGLGASSFVPLHHHCLFLRGIPLGELWHLTELAAWLREHGRHSFMLTAPPLRLPGAVGSPVTPVANV